VEVPDVADGDEAEERPGTIERLWTIQCKREKSIHPSDVKKIIQEAIPDGGEAPYGFILAAACDFSKKSRDTFIIELRDRGVEEFYLWGKADLEDVLFLPKNDHLLFAYFGISLQIRQRTLKTAIRSRLATKRNMIRLLGEIQKFNFKNVLVRNANADTSGSLATIGTLVDQGQIAFTTFIGHPFPDHLGFIVDRYFAYVDGERMKWDAMFGAPERRDFYSSVSHEHIDSIYKPTNPSGWKAFNELDRNRKAWYNVIGFIHYDRVIAVDEHGDSWIEGPHLYVEPLYSSGLFDPTLRDSLSEYPSGSFLAIPESEHRIEIFPSNLREAIAFPATLEDIPSSHDTAST
jgi:hypothetical protein